MTWPIPITQSSCHGTMACWCVPPWVLLRNKEHEHVSGRTKSRIWDAQEKVLGKRLSQILWWEHHRFHFKWEDVAKAQRHVVQAQCKEVPQLNSTSWGPWNLRGSAWRNLDDRVLLLFLCGFKFGQPRSQCLWYLHEDPTHPSPEFHVIVTPFCFRFEYVSCSSQSGGYPKSAKMANDGVSDDLSWSNLIRRFWSPLIRCGSGLWISSLMRQMLRHWKRCSCGL